MRNRRHFSVDAAGRAVIPARVTMGSQKPATSAVVTLLHVLLVGAVTFVAASIAIWGTIHGWGPFALKGSHQGLVLLQLFMAVVAVTGLLLGAAITERDRAERRAATDYEQLRASERRLRLALDAGRMGVWDWNIATGQVTWSENLEPIHGMAPGSFAGTIEGVEALVHPEDRELVKRAIARALEQGTGYDIEFRNRWPDTSVHWMAAKGTVRRDASGRPVRMIGVCTDVTERRRLEEELRQRAGELADADRRKDEFLAMLAHELRNPLTALTNALHLIGLGAADSERFLEISNRQVKQLVRLVDDLLDVARITQGKVALRKEIVPLADVIAAAVESVRPVIDARQHALTVSLPIRSIELEADRARLAQVIANLLGNAAKYTPTGGSIWLTAERLDDRVLVRVRDTGVGLEPELLPHVFDLFVQGAAAPDRAPGGLGIGLTIVRRLVEMHGGTVEARSPGVGLGSEFLLRLPARPLPSVETVASPLPAPAPSPAGLRVLVVEDNELTAESLALVLRLWGHEVYVAPDAALALELAAHHEPNVILSDIGLPGMDGYELARRLREGRTFGGAVLIALTGYGREDDRRRALDAGFDHHLVKPPDLDALAHLLGRMAARTTEQPGRTLH